MRRRQWQEPCCLPSNFHALKPCGNVGALCRCTAHSSASFYLKPRRLKTITTLCSWLFFYTQKTSYSIYSDCSQYRFWSAQFAPKHLHIILLVLLRRAGKHQLYPQGWWNCAAVGKVVCSAAKHQSEDFYLKSLRRVDTLGIYHPPCLNLLHALCITAFLDQVSWGTQTAGSESKKFVHCQLLNTHYDFQCLQVYQHWTS